MLNLRVVIFIIVLLLFVGCSQRSEEPLGVNITAPQDGSKTTSPVDFNFNVTGEIPDGFKPVVFIRDPLGQLWPWLHVENLGNGNWVLPGVSFGNENDCGQTFELHVVITSETSLKGPLSTLPDGMSHFVAVTRACG